MEQKDKHKDYFEGILQIRGGSEELLQWVRKKVKKDSKAWIAKEKKVRGGTDFYLSDQRYLQSLGKKLKETFGGIIKISKKLHTTDKMTGKFLYRVNVLFRPIGYKKGDKVTVRGEEYTLVKIANKAHLKNEESGKKKIVDISELIR